MAEEKLKNVVAATAFCRGFTPEALEGVTLAEVLDRIRETAHCLNDMWDASEARCGWDVEAVLQDAETILAHFQQEKGDG